MIGIMKLFKRKSRWRASTTEPHRYDCSDGNNGWRHTCNITKDSYFEIHDGPKLDHGSYRKCHGHLSPHVRLGDEIIITLTKGDSVWRVVEIENCSDPRDMYFATIAAMGYMKDVPKRDTIESISKFI